jgi:V/A-type H+-transporting ATPase subunit D
LQVYPAQAFEPGELIHRTARAVMGVRLQDARWCATPSAPAVAIDGSEEAQTCRNAFVSVVATAAELAGVIGNLERLRLEYRRSLRRARALHDVLLPELDRDVQEIELRLEELEQEDAIAMRPRR